MVTMTRGEAAAAGAVLPIPNLLFRYETEKKSPQGDIDNDSSVGLSEVLSNNLKYNGKICCYVSFHNYSFIFETDVSLWVKRRFRTASARNRHNSGGCSFRHLQLSEYED